MKLAAFDLEIAKEIPAGASDWGRYEPLGVSCAAVAFSDNQKVRFWQGTPQMTRDECQALVRDLYAYVRDGYTLLTWNGCKFDFNVLAQESGLYDMCAEMAMDHVDLMLMVTFSKGHYLSLQAALDGAGLEGKLKSVTLKDGKSISDMDGAKAPSLWAAGEWEAVLAYLKEDVVQLQELAEFIQRRGMLRWTSRSGRPQNLPVSRLLTVRECFKIPEPDMSWARNPPTRGEFVSWMPPAVNNL